MGDGRTELRACRCLFDVLGLGTDGVEPSTPLYLPDFTMTSGQWRDRTSDLVIISDALCH